MIQVLTIEAAIVEHAKNSLGLDLESPTNYKAVAGQGLECKVDGTLILVGNRKWMKSNFLEVTNEMNEKATFLENQVSEIIFSIFNRK